MHCAERKAVVDLSTGVYPTEKGRCGPLYRCLPHRERQLCTSLHVFTPQRKAGVDLSTGVYLTEKGRCGPLQVFTPQRKAGVDLSTGGYHTEKGRCGPLCRCLPHRLLKKHDIVVLNFVQCRSETSGLCLFDNGLNLYNLL